MARLRQSDLVDLNKSFEERTPQEIIQWGKEIFGERLASISSMQEAGNVICHMLSQLDLGIKVLFVDTGVLFEETLWTRDRLAEAYNLTIETLRPEKTMQQQTAELGILYMNLEGQKQCCHLRKVEPLLKIKHHYDAIIGSLRRSDGGKRADCPFLAVDPEMNSLRINPLASFSNEQMNEYIREHDVILNPLLAQGYTTIGCNRCTTPTLPDEPRRAGRWRHLGPWAVYCGINPTDLDPDGSPFIELPQDLVDRILGIETDFMI